MHTFQEIHLAYEDYLQKELTFPQEPANLFDPCRKILAAGGKRIRPALCLMGHELFQPLNQDAYFAAMAIELFHNFTLIHDDLMDHAPLRRGQQTVHEEYGMPGAVLSGDIMNIFAYRYINKVDDKKQAELLRIFNQAAMEVCIGQQMDMDFETQEAISKESYIDMITLKTSVLLGMSLEAGALLANAEKEERRLIYKFGKNLGLAFQLQDDYLDAFGTREEIGKLPGGDIRSNKKTFLNICCMEMANEFQLTGLKTAETISQEQKVKETIELYRALKVDQISRVLIDEYVTKALSSLQELNKSKEELKPLKDLTLWLMNRKH